MGLEYPQNMVRWLVVSTMPSLDALWAVVSTYQFGMPSLLIIHVGMTSRYSWDRRVQSV